MRDTIQFLGQYGYALVLVTALLEQLGLPIPAAPVLLAAGALAGSGQLSATAAIALATLASVIADAVWYGLGRKRGGSILNLLCRISLEADSCVSETKNLFEKLGSSALVIAKFVPGLSTIAPPLAGVTRMPLPRFLLLDLAGSALWASAYVLLGVAFSSQLERVLEWAARFGSALGVLVVLPLASYIGFKYWQRHRFIRSLRTHRIAPDELLKRIQAGEDLVVIDLRHFTELVPGAMKIPGAIWYRRQELETRHEEIPRDRDVILYCSCPNEATAAGMALKLHKLGITRVRPLLGGIEEWTVRGYPLEPAAVLTTEFSSR